MTQYGYGEGDGAIGRLVEIGCSSLSFHHLHHGFVRTVKWPCALGHEVSRTGAISETAIQGVIEAIRSHGTPPLAVATATVRRASNGDAFCDRLYAVLGVHVSVLTLREEAGLLARAFTRKTRRRPAMVVNVGGATAMIVQLGSNLEDATDVLYDELPIGPAELSRTLQVAGKDAMEELLRSHLERSARCPNQELFLSGSAVKPVGRVLGKTNCDRSELAALEERVHREGPPPRLRGTRARMFYPAALLVHRLAVATGAERVHFERLSVGRRALIEWVGAPGESGGRLGSNSDPTQLLGSNA